MSLPSYLGVFLNVPREQTLQQLADLVGGSVAGDPQLVVCGLNGIEQAGPGEITFLLDARHLPLPEGCRASACIVPTGCGPLPLSTIVTDQPAVAAARIHAFLLEQPFAARGVHPSAVVGSDCRIPEQVSVGPLVCLGDRVVLGERVTIHPGVVIGSDTTIGVQLQNDNIHNGLYHTRQRQILSTTRQDHIVETSIGVCSRASTPRSNAGSWRSGGSAMNRIPCPPSGSANPEPCSCTASGRPRGYSVQRSRVVSPRACARGTRRAGGACRVPS